MITVSKEQLNTVEYLLDQSAKGNHVLFDHTLITQVLTTHIKPMNEDEAYEVEHHIEKIISFKTINEQRAYLDQLPEATLHRVIKTYFNIVENNLFETTDQRH